MSQAAIATEGSLRRRFRERERSGHVRALLLVLPLFVFVLMTFAIPIGRMLYRGIEDPEVGDVLPDTARELRAWTGSEPRPPAIARSLVREMPRAAHERTLASVAQRLNHDIPGMRSLILATARALPEGSIDDADATLAAIDPRWQDRSTWAAFRRAALPLTDFYLLSAVDLKHDVDGRIVAMPEGEAVFVAVLERTMIIAGGVTALCLILGFPVAYLLVTISERTANLLMILVLLPFWTSLLVRTSAWVVTLQKEGVINSLLLGLDLVNQPQPMIFNRFGVFVAMTHVLLPFMILPLYSVMKGINPATVRAASSLGAPPAVAFRRVFLPQAMPGVVAGSLLVVILALGYYITPALIGGADDQMLSYFIAFYTTRTVNWGLAAALATLLLAATLILFLVFSRLAARVYPVK